MEKTRAEKRGNPFAETKKPFGARNRDDRNNRRTKKPFGHRRGNRKQLKPKNTFRKPKTETLLGGIKNENDRTNSEQATGKEQLNK